MVRLTLAVATVETRFSLCKRAKPRRWDNYFSTVYNFFLAMYLLALTVPLLVFILKPGTFSSAEALIPAAMMLTLLTFDCFPQAESFNPTSLAAKKRLTLQHEMHSFLRCSIRVSESATAMAEKKMNVRVSQLKCVEGSMCGCQEQEGGRGGGLGLGENDLPLPPFLAHLSLSLIRLLALSILPTYITCLKIGFSRDLCG